MLNRVPKILGVLYIQIKSLVLQNFIPSLGKKIQNPYLGLQVDGSVIFLYYL